MAGDLEPLGRITLDVHDVQPGDISWALPKTGCAKVCLEEAFARSALGVVAAGRRIEPWAGKFAIDVEDPGLALQRLAETAAELEAARLVTYKGAWMEAREPQNIQTGVIATMAKYMTSEVAFRASDRGMRILAGWLHRRVRHAALLQELPTAHFCTHNQ